MPIVWLHSKSVAVILKSMSMLDAFFPAHVLITMIMYWTSNRGQLTNSPGQTCSMNTED